LEFLIYYPGITPFLSFLPLQLCFSNSKTFLLITILQLPKQPKLQSQRKNRPVAGYAIGSLLVKRPCKTRASSLPFSMSSLLGNYIELSV